MSGANRIEYADDDTESIDTLLRLRAPTLFVGLVLGIAISFVTSRFEDVLAHNIRAVFFLPFIVYITDAIAAQTVAIYARDLRTGKARFKTYFIKESILGVFLGGMFGFISAAIIELWFRDNPLALSVGLSVLIAGTIAPLVAICTAHTIQSLKQDPAAETGPIATVIQDMLSVVIYGTVCSFMLL